MDRVAIFVDGAAMFYAQRENKWHIDYRNVYNYFTDNREKAGAWYFTATPSSGDVEKLKNYREFRKALTRIGYSVKDKEVRKLYDKNTGAVRYKGNLDIELVFRMLTSIQTYDVAILLGGDSDYVPVIEHLINNGKKVVIAGRRQTTATELINAASEFIDLNDIRSRISKVR